MTQNKAKHSSASKVGFYLMTLAVVATNATAQQSPWGQAAEKLSTEFTGPIARGFVLVAAVVSGLSVCFSEGGGKSTISKLIFGGALALGAVQIVTWLFV